MKTLELKKIFIDICNGFSYSKVLNLYIKHPTIHDEVECDEFREEAKIRAVSHGLKTEEEILADCISRGEWSEQKNKSLESIENDYHRLNVARFNPVSEFQLFALRKELKDTEESWNRLAQEKYSLLSNSVERFGDRAAHDRMLLLSIFSDSKCSIKAFDDEEFEYLDDLKFSKISREVDRELNKFNLENIGAISVEHFFQRRMVSLFDFFGKPAYQLTDYQITLLKLGEKYKPMIEECGDLPEDYVGIDGLEDYFYLKRANVLKTEEEKRKERAKWE